MVSDKHTPNRKPLVLLVTGGASGVGKSTVLKNIPIKTQFNTGTLFKQHMTLVDRDAIRSADWSHFEEQVANDLSTRTIASFTQDESVVIDTHFAAKLRGKYYRIGLKRNLIFELGAKVFQYAEQTQRSLEVYVILITCGPSSLLVRRRLDKSRNRDLIPSDCFNTLRDNKVNANQYLAELLRARQTVPSTNGHKVSFHVIENEDLDIAIKQFNMILESK